MFMGIWVVRLAVVDGRERRLIHRRVSRVSGALRLLIKRRWGAGVIAVLRLHQGVV